MSTATFLTHEPPAPPVKSTHVSVPRRQILLRHPWYDDSINVLLRLFALDRVTDVAGWGLYAQFALDACGIIAGNRWDGWLSESKDPTIAGGTGGTGGIESTSILEKSNYYFHLPAEQSGIDNHVVNGPYPIVPTFRSWRFPHDELPNSWKKITPAAFNPTALNKSFSPSNLTLALQERDVSCRITGCYEGTQVAHICPKKEEPWWHRNGMSRYNTSSADTLNDLSNALLLRSDLHSAFGKPKFVFVPKTSSGFECPKIVSHLLEPSSELESLYHNHRLQEFRSSIQVLFARFAWTIFPLLDSFLNCGERRRLLVANGSTDSVDDDGFVSPEECATFLSKGSRSVKKRKSDIPGANDYEPSYTVDEGEEPRPRKKRQFSNRTPSVQSTEPMQDSSQILDLVHSISQISSTGPATSPSTAFSTSDSSHLLDRDVASTTDNGADVTLAQAWLAQERLRSDPSSQWEKDKAWAKRVSKGDVTLSAEEARRWMEICGAEIQDE